MPYIIENMTTAQREAAEAENTRPLTWDEYQKAMKADPAKRAGLIDRLQMETVPADIRGIIESVKRGRR